MHQILNTDATIPLVPIVPRQETWRPAPRLSLIIELLFTWANCLFKNRAAVLENALMTSCMQPSSEIAALYAR